MIKALFFDLDDTLLWDEKSVKDAFVVTCKLAEVKYNLDPETLEQAVRKAARHLYESYDTYSFTQMIGINPFEGLWGDFQDEGAEFQALSHIVPTYRKAAWTNGLLALGVDDSAFGAKLAEYFPKARKSHPNVYEDTFPLLDEVKGKYKLLLLTNGSPQLQNIKLTITPELVPYFDEIIISGDFGRGKPDVTLFEHALNKIGARKDEVLMIGDNLKTDILGASRIGMKSVWINRHHKQKDIDVTPTYEIDHLDQLKGILKETD